MNISKWTYRIEDLEQFTNEFSHRLNKHPFWSENSQLPKDLNTKKPHSDFTWENLQQQLDPTLYLNIWILAQNIWLRACYPIAAKLDLVD